MTPDSAKPIKHADSDRPQPIDIATRLRQTRANMLGTDDEAHYWDCHEAANEIERLRTIMHRIVDEDCTVAIQGGTFYADDEPLFPLPCTPQMQSTPGEGSKPREYTVPPAWLQRPYLVDPPSGWRYGFPRRYDPAADGDLTAWMISNGYPESLAREGVVCTFTSCDD